MFFACESGKIGAPAYAGAPHIQRVKTTEKNQGSSRSLEILCIRVRQTSHRALHAVGTEAPGAHVDMAGFAVYDGLDTFDIRFPGPVGASVRVGDLDAEGHAFAANIAFCHHRTSF